MTPEIIIKIVVRKIFCVSLMFAMYFAFGINLIGYLYIYHYCLKSEYKFCFSYRISVTVNYVLKANS